MPSRKSLKSRLFFSTFFFSSRSGISRGMLLSAGAPSVAVSVSHLLAAKPASAQPQQVFFLILSVPSGPRIRTRMYVPGTVAFAQKRLRDRHSSPHFDPLTAALCSFRCKRRCWSRGWQMRPFSSGAMLYALPPLHPSIHFPDNAALFTRVS